MTCPGTIFSTTSRAQVMGIVNLNDDSFSGDGTLDPDTAIRRARRMIADGADIIDLGAESARTNRGAIDTSEEIARLQPVVAALKDSPTPPQISINTWRPEVAREILPMGIDLLNDIGALPDDTNARLCAEHDCALLIMHSVGQPKVAHTGQRYDDVWSELLAFFSEKIGLAEAAGLPRRKLVLDPGIDFAKQRDDNLAIYRELERLKVFDLPILLPVSRKTVIGDVLGIADPAGRDAGTIACIEAGLRRGASIFRVHHVRAAKQALQVLEPLTRAT
jgi:dihydropteroate synthase